MGESTIYIIVSFIFVIALFIFALFKFVLTKSTNKPIELEEDELDLSSIMMILDSRNSTIEDLQNAIDKFLANYEKLTPNKIQLKNVLIALSLHRNANKDIILESQRRIQEKNPELEYELEKAVKKGLDARR